MNDDSLKRAQFVSTLAPGAHVHVSGVCGTGTAAVLSLLKQLGFRVTGSDKAFYPPMGELVRSLADKVFEGYKPENLNPRPDLVIIGNSLSRGNPEIEYVLEQNIPYASMPEVFSALLIGDREHCRNSVVVCGTHGKTTTTALIATMLDNAGLKPGYFIGGKPIDLPSTIRTVDADIEPAKRAVVLEGDEYDSAFFAKWAKFHSYRPDIAVITSLEFDHADIYENIEQIEGEFSRFVKLIPDSGALVVCDDGGRLRKLAEGWKASGEFKGQLIFYGENHNDQSRLLTRASVSGGQEIVVSVLGDELKAKVQLGGPHNALNYLAAATVGKLLGLNQQQIATGLSAFHGVFRRQQLIFDARGVRVIEDFAHHPTAVKVTLTGIKELYRPKRLIAVFEPRSNTSRRGFFQKEYAESFDAADMVMLLEVANAGGYSKTASEIKPLDVGQIAREVSAKGITAATYPTVEEIKTFLVGNLVEGDVVVLMSNGDFGGLPNELVAALH